MQSISTLSIVLADGGIESNLEMFKILEQGQVTQSATENDAERWDVESEISQDRKHSGNITKEVPVDHRSIHDIVWSITVVHPKMQGPQVSTRSYSMMAAVSFIYPWHTLAVSRVDHGWHY